MQDRYAGDVGDLIKFALMRHVAAPLDSGGAGLTAGLNWYLAGDESHTADGKHVTYLDPSNRHHSSLAACDPELIDCLRRVVAADRSVDALELSGALPPGSPTHRERLGQGQGWTDRTAWHQRALAALASADVVFTDPDNGICSSAKTTKLQKYALMSELADYAHRGQSLVAYQHADRSAPAATQARHRLCELSAGVGQAPVGAVIARRGSCRFFLVTAAEPHQEKLTLALRAFAFTWAPHAELVEHHQTRGSRPAPAPG